MIFTLPLPGPIQQYFPVAIVQNTQWFAFYAFAGLLMIPWLFCVYRLVTKYVGRRKRVRFLLKEHSAPKMVIVMPCYNEKPAVLMATVDSIVGCDYLASCMHIFLSFDGDAATDDYFHLLESLGVPLNTVFMKNASYPKSIDIMYRQCRITVSRFPHGGKRNCQKLTFKLIDKVYDEYLKRNDNLFILFIDSDCILDKHCIQNFMWEMELKPGLEKGKMLAMTGVITSHARKNTIITLLQDMEYIHGQLFERSVESCAGAVTCLPGALTILRFSAFRVMSKEYFAERADNMEDLFDYGKCHLGEDRWLTHLFMVGAQQRYQIQMCTSAFCKTEAVETWKSLLKQRRRWFIGFITNEACMLTDWRLWKRYPLVCLLRLAQNTIRTTALLFVIMVFSVFSTEETIKQLPIGFIAISLGINWALMLYLGWKLRRYKIMLYPLMFLVNPVLNWVYMINGIMTAKKKTWGGPRADAAKADENTTPRQAIEQAELAEDDLNIDVSSFRAAVERKKSVKGEQFKPMPILPEPRVEGRFAAAQRMDDGYYQLPNASGLTLAGPSDLQRPRVPCGHHRDSTDSMTTLDTDMYSPRRIESFLPDEDIKRYYQNQKEIVNQNPPGGQDIQQQMDEHMRHLRGEVYGPAMVGSGKGKESMESFDSLPMLNTRQPELPQSTIRSNSPAPALAGAAAGYLPSQSPRMRPHGYVAPPSRLSNRHVIECSSSSSYFSQPPSGSVGPSGIRSNLGRQSLHRSSEDVTTMPPLEVAETTSGTPFTDPRVSSPAPSSEIEQWPPRSTTPNAPWTPGQTSVTPSEDTPFFGHYAHAEGSATPLAKREAEKEKKKRRRLTKDKWIDKKGGPEL